MAVLLLTIVGWLAGATFQAVARGDRSIHYLIVSLPFASIPGWLGGAVVVVLLLQFAGQAVRSSGPENSTVEPPARPLSVIGWIAVPLVPLLNLVGPLAGTLPPFTYILYELRWAWWALIALIIVWRLLPPSMGRDLPGVLALVTIVLLPPLWATLSTPVLRFSGILHGDEPKYIRYCENFYQGRGFNVAGKKSLAELAGQDEPHVGENFRTLWRTVPSEIGLLRSDLRRLLNLPAPPRLVAQPPTPAMVFAGKQPGTVYQLHNPGVSFLLFPAYYIDRRWTGSGVGYRGEFPANMPAVHSTLLTLYALYAVGLFRLLTTYGAPRHLAWLLALVAVLSLPTGAFAFQIYPEIPAGIIVCIVLGVLLNRRPLSASRAAAYGALAGFLPWLHVRFGLASVVCLCWMAIQRFRARRERAAFALGVLAGLVTVSFYTYHLTGSLLPVSTYGSEVPLSVWRVVKGVPAFAVERTWGLFPHAPLFILAVPGVAFAYSRSRFNAIALLALLLSIVVPAAGHGFWAGGATVGRYLVTVVPVLLLFVFDAFAGWSRRAPFVAAVVLAGMLSLETAVSYNLHHRKHIGPLVSEGISGWRFNDLFPALGTDTWTASRFDVGLLVCWIGALSVLFWVAWRRSGDLHGGGDVSNRGTLVRQVFIASMLVAVTGTLAAYAGGRLLDPTYLVPARVARERLLEVYSQRDRPAWFYSSAEGAVAPTEALGNTLGRVFLRIEPRSPRAGQRVRILVRPRSTDGEFVLSTIRLDVGEGGPRTYRRVFRDLDERHTYAQTGDYTIVAWVRTSSGVPLQVGQTLHVAP